MSGCIKPRSTFKSRFADLEQDHDASFCFSLSPTPHEMRALFTPLFPLMVRTQKQLVPPKNQALLDWVPSLSAKRIKLSRRTFPIETAKKFNISWTPVSTFLTAAKLQLLRKCPPTIHECGIRASVMKLLDSHYAIKRICIENE